MVEKWLIYKNMPPLRTAAGITNKFCTISANTLTRTYLEGLGHEIEFNFFY